MQRAGVGRRCLLVQALCVVAFHLALACTLWIKEKAMGIFDVMLQSETKTRFTEHRDQAIGVSEREKEKLRAYVFSESCTQAIERLGGFFY